MAAMFSLARNNRYGSGLSGEIELPPEDLSPFLRPWEEAGEEREKKRWRTRPGSEELRAGFLVRAR